MAYNKSMETGQTFILLRGRGTGAATRVAANAAATSATGHTGGKRRKTKRQLEWEKLTPAEKEALQQERKAATEAAFAKAEQGVKDMMHHPEIFRMWLASLPDAYTLSLNNYALVRSQLPEATQVNKYDGWQAAGRQVKKGEHKLTILFPTQRKSPVPDPNNPKEQKKDPVTGEPVYNYYTAFYPAPGVFDISQTEPIDPSAAQSQVNPDRQEAAQQAFDDLQAQAESMNIHVFVDGNDPSGISDPVQRRGAQRANDKLLTNPDMDGVYFEYHADGMNHKAIAVRQQDDTAAAANAFAHEFGHALMHTEAQLKQNKLDVDKPGSKEVLLSQQQQELEAESFAYAFASAYGIQRDADSFGYLTAMAGSDNGHKKLLAAGQRVRGAMKTVLDPAETA